MGPTGNIPSPGKLFSPKTTTGNHSTPVGSDLPGTANFSFPGEAFLFPWYPVDAHGHRLRLRHRRGYQIEVTTDEDELALLQETFY